jgi:hypothetical protein
LELRRSLPDDSRRHFGTSHLVDIGLYGEPMVPGYRHIRDMRALQQMVDSPSLWGVSYLTWDEITAANPERYARYEQVRRRYNADAAFLHLKEKVVWVDPGQADRGKIPLWRLYRSFGPRWYLNPAVYCSWSWSASQAHLASSTGASRLYLRSQTGSARRTLES